MGLSIVQAKCKLYIGLSIVQSNIALSMVQSTGWERSGSVVECLTRDQEAAPASLRCVLEQEH